MHLLKKSIIITTTVLILIATLVIANETTPLREIRIGEIFTQHQSQKKLEDVALFYEQIEKFSKDTVNGCSNAQNKEICIQNQREQAFEKYNLNITNCEQKEEEFNLTKIKQTKETTKSEDYGYYEITGKVTEFIDHIEPAIKLNLTNEIITIQFTSAIGINTMSESLGQYIRVGGRINEIDTNSKTITMMQGDYGVPTPQRHKYITLNPYERLEQTNTNTIIQIANCAFSENETCKCNIQFPKEQEKITFEKNNYYTDENTKHYVPTQIYAQDIGIMTEIKALTEIKQNNIPEGLFNLDGLIEIETYKPPEPTIIAEINMTENNYELNFKKSGDKLIIIQEDVEPNLQECEIKTKTYLFCAKLITDKYEKEEEPSMNFALKI